MELYFTIMYDEHAIQGNWNYVRILFLPCLCSNFIRFALLAIVWLRTHKKSAFNHKWTYIECNESLLLYE